MCFCEICGRKEIEMACDPKTARRWLSQWLQYIYFLRFPILAWLLLPVLCLVDGCTGVSALTRGIMTLGRGWQAFYAAFFVPTLLMSVLVCARNIVRNGRSRFRSTVPPSLRRALTKSRPGRVWTVLAIAHIPTIITLAYVACATIQEHEAFRKGYWKLWACYAAGLACAFAFWYLVSLFYLWTYPAAPGKTPSSLIYPGTMWGFAAAQGAPQPRIAVWIAAAGRKVLGVTHSGYAATSAGPLYELHSLTTVALGAFLLLYLFLYPLIAPVVVNNGHAEIALAVGIVIVFAFGARTRGGGISTIGRSFLTLLCVLLVLFVGVLLYDCKHGSVLMQSAFPSLASILVILIFLLWLISGASFLLDRYRIPVLTLVVFSVFVSKSVLPADQEHYFEATDTTRVNTPDTPEKALENRIKAKDEPYIIVTASGGGIQAAEWTARVMAQLETQFHDDSYLNGSGKHYSFHDHLLLASGVSGGSVGLMPYLLEYSADPANAFPMHVPVDGTKDLLTERLTRAPGCSSLEAVAWGLEYYDLQRLLLTVRIPWLQSTKNGDEPDRTWALSEAFQRNLKDNDYNCETIELNEKAGNRPDLKPAEEVTLKKATELLEKGEMPAFTFNTTVAETGGRFLLSNYDVPAIQAGKAPGPLQAGSDFLPAESFLQAYMEQSECDQGNLKSDCYANISLATAARLSATFPYVSSGTRIPKKYAGLASHFLDGGYFDNDGTASVLEFLDSAMEERKQANETARKTNPKAAGPYAKLKVLLVEIRDGDDLNPVENMDDWNHQTGTVVDRGGKTPTPWTTASQLVGPLEGMWNAGHVSVTRRNRRELCSVERAFGSDEGVDTGLLEIHHVVLGITAEPKTGKPGQYKAAPLNWKLTASQKQYIQNWTDEKNKPTQQTIAEALLWVKKQMGYVDVDNTLDKDAVKLLPLEACEVADQTYVRH
jgi:hypothetical protein